MPYAVQSDLLLVMSEQEMIQLTDDSRPPTTVSATVVTGAIAEAQALVESYCRTRYQVPLQTSVDVTRITRDLAAYYLYQRRPQKMTENIRLLYSNAIALLKDISSGKASLDQPAGALAAQTEAGGPVLPSCNDQRFTNQNLEGFV